MLTQRTLPHARAQGLLELSFADEEELKEPQRLYCMPGLSFTPEDLFEEIRHFKPDFDVTYGPPDPDVRPAGVDRRQPLLSTQRAFPRTRAVCCYLCPELIATPCS